MSDYEKDSFDVAKLSQFSPQYLARALADSRYLADSFGKRIKELEEQLAECEKERDAVFRDVVGRTV